jgi:hypothetical protein
MPCRVRRVYLPLLFVLPGLFTGEVLTGFFAGVAVAGGGACLSFALRASSLCCAAVLAFSFPLEGTTGAATGGVGDDASTLLGSFLVTVIQLAAMSRADQPEEQRRDFFLYVDEFQNFATDSFASILSEARKYRVSLTLANQYLAQLEDSTLHALFGNVGSLLTFQVGAKDAEILTEQLGGDLTAQDLLRLPCYHAYARLLIEGMPSRPFSMQTVPPRQPTEDDRRRAMEIRRASRHRYSRPVDAVEAEIRAAFA